MFMRRNRQTNGAAQPEQTAAADAPRQKKARQLAPNGDLPGNAMDLRFEPDMSTADAINNDHYAGGLKGSGPYGKSYENKILFVGDKPAPTGKGRDLKGR